MPDIAPWPTELRLTGHGSVLTVSFDGGTQFDLPAEYLRVESPSAEVQGHGPGQRKTQFGKSRVRITEILPTGNYAVRLVFDDHHSTGIFTYAYLHELGAERETRWRKYLDELKAAGLSRDAVAKP